MAAHGAWSLALHECPADTVSDSRSTHSKPRPEHNLLHKRTSKVDCRASGRAPPDQRRFCAARCRLAEPSAPSARKPVAQNGLSKLRRAARGGPGLGYWPTGRPGRPRSKIQSRMAGCPAGVAEVLLPSWYAGGFHRASFFFESSSPSTKAPSKGQSHRRLA